MAKKQNEGQPKAKAKLDTAAEVPEVLPPTTESVTPQPTSIVKREEDNESLARLEMSIQRDIQLSSRLDKAGAMVAIKIGLALRSAKDLLRHGEYGPWQPLRQCVQRAQGTVLPQTRGGVSAERGGRGAADAAPERGGQLAGAGRRRQPAPRERRRVRRRHDDRRAARQARRAPGENQGRLPPVRVAGGATRASTRTCKTRRSTCGRRKTARPS